MKKFVFLEWKCRRKAPITHSGDTNFFSPYLTPANPPYQLETGSTSRQATPIYNLFVNQAKALSPQFLSMIMPSRWFAGGMGLDDFRNEMMHDKHIRKIVDYVNAKDCFPQISISGGICYFLRDLKYEGDCCFTSVYRGNQNVANRPMDEFDVLVRYNESVSIIHAVKLAKEESMSSIVSSISPFGLTTKERGTIEKTSENNITLYSSAGVGYLSEDKILKGYEYLPKYKVMISQTSGEHAGEPGKDGKFRILTSAMRILKPQEICTHSYLIIGMFDSEEEAANLWKYLRTKFVRFLLLQALSSIHISKSTFAFVPVQDFTKSWTDRELYAKYHLTEEEIGFIESTIKPMEFDGPEPEEAAPAK